MQAHYCFTIRSQGKSQDRLWQTLESPFNSGPAVELRGIRNGTQLWPSGRTARNSKWYSTLALQMPNHKHVGAAQLISPQEEQSGHIESCNASFTLRLAIISQVDRRHFRLTQRLGAVVITIIPEWKVTTLKRNLSNQREISLKIIPSSGRILNELLHTAAVSNLKYPQRVFYALFREGERRKWDKEENERGRDRERRKAFWVSCRENFERKSTQVLSLQVQTRLSGSFFQNFAHCTFHTFRVWSKKGCSAWHMTSLH